MIQSVWRSCGRNVQSEFPQREKAYIWNVRTDVTQSSLSFPKSMILQSRPCPHALACRQGASLSRALRSLCDRDAVAPLPVPQDDMRGASAVHLVTKRETDPQPATARAKRNSGAASTHHLSIWGAFVCQIVGPASVTPLFVGLRCDP